MILAKHDYYLWRQKYLYINYYLRFIRFDDVRKDFCTDKTIVFQNKLCPDFEWKSFIRTI